MIEEEFWTVEAKLDDGRTVYLYDRPYVCPLETFIWAFHAPKNASKVTKPLHTVLTALNFDMRGTKRIRIIPDNDINIAARIVPNSFKIERVKRQMVETREEFKWV